MNQQPSNVIPFDKAKRDERLTGGIGDRFRTAEAQEIFRARWNAAQAKLAQR